MFDYIVVVVNDDLEARKLADSSLRADVFFSSIFLPVPEGGWNGAAGNGLGTLFAIENASNAIGKDLVEEVKQGKSVLIVHTVGLGSRNILTRTVKNKALIEVPNLTILEGVIKQFQDFAVPSRILVTWGDQFLLVEDSAEEIRKCAQNTHVMLFGLKTKLTEEVASKYGIQIVQCTEGEGCELLDFDDTRNYELVKRKLQRQGESEVMVNLGMFAMSGVMAECMLNAFSDELEAKEGKFNSDELWQLEISQEPELGDEADYWLSGRANKIRKGIFRAEPLAVIKSFPLSDKTAWLDFGTNESYYENVMRFLNEGDLGRRLRAFIGVEISSVKNGCEVLDSVYENSHFEKGLVKSSVISNSTANHAQLEQACVINSTLNRIRGKNCVVYNVVDHASIEVEDCFLVDVFHPNMGKIRLKMRIGEERGPKEKWWYSCLPYNELPLSEVADMLKGMSEKAAVVYRQTKGTSLEDLGTGIYCQGQNLLKELKVRDLILFEKGLANLEFLLSAMCAEIPKEEGGREACELLEKGKKEKYIDCKISLIDIVLGIVLSHMSKKEMKKIEITASGPHSRVNIGSEDKSVNITGDLLTDLESLRFLIKRDYTKGNKVELVQTVELMRQSCNDPSERNWLREKLGWILTKTSEVSSISSLVITLLKNLV